MRHDSTTKEPNVLCEMHQIAETREVELVDTTDEVDTKIVAVDQKKILRRYTRFSEIEQRIVNYLIWKVNTNRATENELNDFHLDIEIPRFLDFFGLDESRSETYDKVWRGAMGLFSSVVSYYNPHKKRTITTSFVSSVSYVPEKFIIGVSIDELMLKLISQVSKPQDHLPQKERIGYTQLSLPLLDNLKGYYQPQLYKYFKSKVFNTKQLIMSWDEFKTRFNTPENTPAGAFVKDTLMPSLEIISLNTDLILTVEKGKGQKQWKKLQFSISDKPKFETDEEEKKFNLKLKKTIEKKKQTRPKSKAGGKRTTTTKGQKAVGRPKIKPTPGGRRPRAKIARSRSEIT